MAVPERNSPSNLCTPICLTLIIIPHTHTHTYTALLHFTALCHSVPYSSLSPPDSIFSFLPALLYFFLMKGWIFFPQILPNENDKSDKPAETLKPRSLKKTKKKKQPLKTCVIDMVEFSLRGLFFLQHHLMKTMNVNITSLHHTTSP